MISHNLRNDDTIMTTIENTTLSRYLNRVNAFPRLSRAEESRLWRQWHEASDEPARDELVQSNLRFAAAIALKYRHYGLPMFELIAEGNYGLLCALSKFEPERGSRFITYAAYWIRAYILEHIIACWSLVGVGSGPLRSKLFFKLRRERVRIQNLVGEGEHADTLLAERMGLSPEQLAGTMQRLDLRDVSLDHPAFDGANISMLDTLISPNCSQEQAYLDLFERSRIRAIVCAALDSLDKREQLIVENHLMRDSEDELSLADIGRRLGISRERARQLETRAKAKLRQSILELTNDADS